MDHEKSTYSAEQRSDLDQLQKDYWYEYQEFQKGKLKLQSTEKRLRSQLRNFIPSSEQRADIENSLILAIANGARIRWETN